MPRRQKSKPVTLACVQALKQVQTTPLILKDTDPTPERLFQAGVSIAMELGSRTYQIIGPTKSSDGGIVGYDRVIRLKQAPLDRLHARGRLAEDPDSNRQLFEAGEKLRDHHHLAGLSGFAANDLLGSSGGGHPASRTPITETMERNRRSLRLAEAATDRDAWHVLRAVVLDEETLEATGQALGYAHTNAANAVALDRLRRGLGDLAALWGFSPPQRPRPAVEAANDATPRTAAA